MRMIDMLRLSGLLSVLGPLTLFLASFALKKRKTLFRVFSVASLCGYALLILYITLLRKHRTEAREFNLSPFWSYACWDQRDIRWQVYMNVFLFIPLGFLLAWNANRGFLQTVLIGCLFSVAIEAVQYFFGLGFCEFDDVFHNTLGALAGYGYWRGLAWIGKMAANFRRRRVSST